MPRTRRRAPVNYADPEAYKKAGLDPQLANVDDDDDEHDAEPAHGREDVTMG